VREGFASVRCAAALLRHRYHRRPRAPIFSSKSLLYPVFYLVVREFKSEPQRRRMAHWRGRHRAVRRSAGRSNCAPPSLSYLVVELITEEKYHAIIGGKFGYKCAKCGTSEELTLHHALPKSRGGTDRISNLICLCWPCHCSEHKRLTGETIRETIHNSDLPVRGLIGSDRFHTPAFQTSFSRLQQLRKKHKHKPCKPMKWVDYAVLYGRQVEGNKLVWNNVFR
jgi:5-methylcytosine-specific restriction endonuclease McrA